MGLRRNLGATALLVALLFPHAASGQSKIADSAEQICPLLPGMKIPGVTLERADGTPFNLLEEVSRQRSILVFYRGGW
jgi:hypothetical protein